MKRNEQKSLDAYEAPQVEVVVVEVEQGFSTSLNDWGKGEHLGDHEAE